MGSFITDAVVLRAAREDAPALIEAQNRAFLADYIRYGECPGYNRSEADMLHSINHRLVFKIVLGGRVIGVASVDDNGFGDYYLGSLCVIPEYEGRGIGQAAMRFLFAHFSDARRWSLETPADKARNIRFYTLLGFSVTREYYDGAVRVAFLEKRC